MEFFYILLAVLIVRFIFEGLNSPEDKKQIKKMQKQIDDLCRLTGHNDLISTVLSEEEKEIVLHLKNTEKKVEAIKKVRDFTSLDLKEAKEYVDSL